MDIDYEKMIEGMCLTYRHDYGLEKPKADGKAWPFGIQSGMNDVEREALRTTMRQLIEHNIMPVIDRLQRELEEARRDAEKLRDILRTRADRLEMRMSFGETHVARAITERELLKAADESCLISHHASFMWAQLKAARQQKG